MAAGEGRESGGGRPRMLESSVRSETVPRPELILGISALFQESPLLLSLLWIFVPSESRPGCRFRLRSRAPNRATHSGCYGREGFN